MVAVVRYKGICTRCLDLCFEGKVFLLPSLAPDILGAILLCSSCREALIAWVRGEGRE